jgi:hypothetical protein
LITRFFFRCHHGQHPPSSSEGPPRPRLSASPRWPRESARIRSIQTLAGHRGRVHGTRDGLLERHARGGGVTRACQE